MVGLLTLRMAGMSELPERDGSRYAGQQEALGNANQATGSMLSRRVAWRASAKRSLDTCGAQVYGTGITGGTLE
jgi:hypothetical protein